MDKESRSSIKTQLSFGLVPTHPSVFDLTIKSNIITCRTRTIGATGICPHPDAKLAHEVRIFSG